MDINERIETEERNDVQNVLSTENGRRLLWRVVSLCGVYQDINSESSQDNNRKLGQRSIGLLLMQIIGDADQDRLFQMMKEAKTRADEIEREAKKLDEQGNDNLPSFNDII